MLILPNIEKVTFIAKLLVLDIMLLSLLVLIVFFWRKHWCLNYSNEYSNTRLAVKEAKSAASLANLVGIILMVLHFCWFFGVFK